MSMKKLLKIDARGIVARPGERIAQFIRRAGKVESEYAAFTKKITSEPQSINMLSKKT